MKRTSQVRLLISLVVGILVGIASVFIQPLQGVADGSTKSFYVAYFGRPFYWLTATSSDPFPARFFSVFTAPGVTTDFDPVKLILSLLFWICIVYLLVAIGQKIHQKIKQ